MTRIIRNRPLGKFEPGFIIRPSRMGIDKIQLNFDIGQTTTDARDEIQRCMASAGETHFLFKYNRGKSFPELRIKKWADDFALRQNSAWLFGGRVILSGRVLRAELSLNLSRWEAHNTSGRRTRSIYHKLYSSFDRSVHISRQSRDWNDNFIPDDMLSEWYSGDRNENMTEYIETISSLLQDQLSVLFGQNITFAPRLHNWTIPAIEFYCEFRAEDAIAVTRSFGDHLCEHYHTFSRVLPLNEIEYLNDTVYYRFRGSSKNKQVALYAKLRDRIRIEQRYFYPRTLFSETRGWHNSTTESLVEFVQLLGDKAVQELEAISIFSQNFNPDRTSTYSDHVDVMVTLASIFQDQSSSMRSIIMDLAVHGRVTVLAGDTQYNNFLQALDRAGYTRRLKRHGGKPGIHTVSGALARHLSSLAPFKCPVDYNQERAILEPANFNTDINDRRSRHR